MKNRAIEKVFEISYLKIALSLCFLFVFNSNINGQVLLENEIKISDFGLHFGGSKVAANATNTGDTATYDYYFGPQISAHGDCIKTYTDTNGIEYVFMTWYRGGKGDRHVMLTRYNTNTGTMATIEFPHRHTGYLNRYWIGESHNTIGIGISPLNGTIHLLYDMHAYSGSRPSDGSFSDDYFRYSYSIANAASLSDADFTLDKFVQNSSGGYKHLRLTGSIAQGEFVGLTYPQYFLNDSGDLFMYMRMGGNNNGAYKFTKYDASTSTWSNFTDFNALNASNQLGVTYNWGLYGNMKYVNGKIRVGFQKRSANNNDKYEYQNGVYYAYSDDQEGKTGWKNHKGEGFSLPLYDAEFTKVMEPGDYVTTTQANKVYIVSGFDWTVTDAGDVHIISKVRDAQFNVTKNLHTYKPAGATDFITSENFSGGSSIYTAGEDVYIIGLSGKKVYVEKAEGGTNNFTRVYEAPDGKNFTHGRAHINNGKLYYYLMQEKSGNERPLYLQVIDLDIVIEPFRVSLTSPFDGETYNVGETVQISADAIDENGSISKVEFRVNGAFYGEDTTAPYAIDWISNTEGAYTIQAVAYNGSAQTVLSSEIIVNLEVNDPTDLTGDIYRIKNFVTKEYLDSEGSDVIASISSVGLDKEWEFVKSDIYYNIDSRTDRGILRAAGSPVGDIINTLFSAPNFDPDKQWTIIYDNDGSYRFETKNGSRFLYHNANGIIEHSTNTDDRAKWIVESTTSLGVSNYDVNLTSVKVYPNPANTNFTIVFKGFNKADIIINDILGKVVYQNSVSNDKVLIENDTRFKSGIYFIKVFDNNHKVHYKKLIIK